MFRRSIVENIFQDESRANPGSLGHDPGRILFPVLTFF